MNKKHWSLGFTMAEMLIVVAIIAVLGGVGFIALQNHQKNMDILECDAIAKEIFVAAQNHLSMAESQGFLGSTSFGRSVNETINGENMTVYYFVGPTDFSSTSNLLDLMLPFGSIDETVRAGGSYIIRYQPNPARVLDVFYTPKTGRKTYTLEDTDYGTVMGYRGESKQVRRECMGGAPLGWYGDEELQSERYYEIKAPSIEVINAERLIVKVADYNHEDAKFVEQISPQLKLKIYGEQSKATGWIDLKKVGTKRRYDTIEDDESFTIVLDDITTKDWRFAMLNKTGEEGGIDSIEGFFIPGENITVQAVAFSNAVLSNIAYSSEFTTNSLYFDILEEEEGKNTALIRNIRHLENLDDNISEVNKEFIENGGETINIVKAKQIVDLNKHTVDSSEPVPVPGESPEEPEEEDFSWKGFTNAIREAKNDELKVHIFDVDDKETRDDCFYPISPSYTLEYDGQGHSIEGIEVNYDGNAGLFGAMIGGSKVSNLELVDFNITSTGTGDNGNAGALAGTLENTTVQNVLARHEQGSNGLEYKITSTYGNAGGLVGDMTGGSVEQCAAALYVQGQTAGGLLGSANVTSDDTPIPLITITASYSGGHTDGTTAHYAETNFNVIATDGTAGGLVGDAKNTTINSCYSTCSAKGKTAAGGLIGSVDNTDTVEYCYATGLVSADTKAHTFLGQGTLKTDNCNYYVSGINGILESGCKATVLPAVLEASDDKNLCKPNKNKPGTEPDSTPKDERAFAVAYDGEIRKQIKAGEPNPRYSYLTIEQICERSKPKDNDGHDIELVTSDFISIHYGDWAEPVALESSLELINAERLTAKVSFDKEKLGEGQMLTMLIKGKTSEQSVYLVFEMAKDATNPTLSLLSKIPKSVEGSTTNYNQGTEIADWFKNVGNLLDTSKGSISINLDDITKPNGHFAQLFPTFIPGENIIVAAAGNEVSQAEMEAIFTGKTVTKGNPVYADGINRVRAGITNSLFADPTYEDKEGNTVEGTDIDKYKADIANFRHLENLDKTISGFGETSAELNITTAVQLNNMDWKEDWDKGWNEATIYKLSDTTEISGNKGLFIPVSPNYVLDYKGTKKKVSGVVVKNADNAGLFGTLAGKDEEFSKISDLQLVDFSVESTGAGDKGNAGVLAGMLKNTEVTNVIAYNSPSYSSTQNVTASVNAGGLIGSMTGGSVAKSAAAVFVESKGSNAGGLIGTVSDASVTASYSGGHATKTIKDGTKIIGVAYEGYNIKATSGMAGGLIGASKKTEFKNCYSTCSATGSTVGGFIGTANDVTKFDNCYATGLVAGDSKEGAFAGELADNTGITAPCQFYEIINERFDKEELYLKAVGNGSSTGITALDQDAGTYNAFIGVPSGWKDVGVTYNTNLNTLFVYNSAPKYSLQTVEQLVGTDTTSGITFESDDFVLKHYGDWPAPEELVINTGSAD